MKEVRTNSEYVKEQAIKKEKIMKVLKQYEEKGILEYGFKKFEYWNGVPYVKIGEDEIVLAITKTYMGTTGIKTIFDYTINGAKNIIETIIKNKALIRQYYITSYGELKYYLIREEK